MNTAVEWLMTKLQSLGVTKEEHYELLCQLELHAKVMENEQRRKDFVNGYKERAKLSGKVFDEISEVLANKLFKQQQEQWNKQEKNQL